MHVQTTQFSLTPAIYFRILLRSALTRYWIVFVLFLLFSPLGMKMTLIDIAARIVVLFLFSGLFFGALALFCAFRSFFLKSDQLLFLARSCELDHAFISEQYADGSMVKINFGAILKTVMHKNYCLLYYSRNGFFYLPFSALSNPADQPVLMTLLKTKLK